MVLKCCWSTCNIASSNARDTVLTSEQKSLPTEAIPVLNASMPVKFTEGQLCRYMYIGIRPWWFCWWELCSYVLEVQYHSWYGQVHIRGRSAAHESNELTATFLILYLYLLKRLAATTEFMAIFQGLKQKQGCQLSRIIQETPDFGSYLPDSRLESDKSQG